MSLQEIPLEARPREKLINRGASALADSELLALLLRTGTRGRSVLKMAQELLDTFGGIGGLLHAGADDLRRFKGLGGNAKRAELLAVMELARRVITQKLRSRPVFDSPQTVRDYLLLELSQRRHEVFAVLFLDARHQLLSMDEMFRGTLTQSSVYPREIVVRALKHNAAAVILAHNHPSGAAEPSKADEHVTQMVKAALALVDVRVLDHIVVGLGQTVSFAERGLL